MKQGSHIINISRSPWVWYAESRVHHCHLFSPLLCSPSFTGPWDIRTETPLSFRSVTVPLAEERRVPPDVGDCRACHTPLPGWWYWTYFWPLSEAFLKLFPAFLPFPAPCTLPSPTAVSLRHLLYRLIGYNYRCQHVTPLLGSCQELPASYGNSCHHVSCSRSSRTWHAIYRHTPSLISLFSWWASGTRGFPELSPWVSQVPFVSRVCPEPSCMLSPCLLTSRSNQVFIPTLSFPGYSRDNPPLPFIHPYTFLLCPTM